jgi:hypothetical protein
MYHLGPPSAIELDKLDLAAKSDEWRQRGPVSVLYRVPRVSDYFVPFVEITKVHAVAVHLPGVYQDPLPTQNLTNASFAD